MNRNNSKCREIDELQINTRMHQRRLTLRDPWLSVLGNPLRLWHIPTTLTAKYSLKLFPELRAQPWDFKGYVRVLNMAAVGPVVEAVRKLVRLSALVKDWQLSRETVIFFCYSDSFLLYDKRALLAGLGIFFRYDAS